MREAFRIICQIALLGSCASPPKQDDLVPLSKYRYNIVSITGPNTVPPKSWRTIQDTTKYF